MFQANGKPWVGAHVAYTEEDTGDKGHAVVGVLADDECLSLGAEDDFFVVPNVTKLLSPLAMVVVTQLIAYYTALGRGLDVDKPRNLAKSVTVE